jgi:hypothetical protein
MGDETGVGKMENQMSPIQSIPTFKFNLKILCQDNKMLQGARTTSLSRNENRVSSPTTPIWANRL